MRSRASSFGIPVRVWAAALLPSPERERFAGSGLSIARASFVIGCVELLAGSALFLVGGLAFMRWGEGIGGWFSEPRHDLADPTVIQGLGLMNWFGWFLHPQAWLFGLIAATGLLRCLVYVAHRQPHGEPLVWLGLRLAQRWRRRRDALRSEQEFGPLRRDRLVEAGPRRLILVSCRPRPEFRDETTVEIDGRFYRLTRVEERAEGRWKALAYHFAEQEEGPVIRRLYRYDRDASSPGGRAG